MEFCREHERAIALREQDLRLKEHQFEYKLSSLRRKRREYERLFTSTFAILVLMAMAFAMGMMASQILLSQQ